MITRMYAVYDRASKGYGPIFCFPNDDIARRSCVATVREAGSMKDFPEDYSCYCLGEFDGETGAFVNLPTAPVLVCKFADLVSNNVEV